jgi:hypothetical protein
VSQRGKLECQASFSVRGPCPSSMGAVRTCAILHSRQARRKNVAKERMKHPFVWGMVLTRITVLHNHSIKVYIKWNSKPLTFLASYATVINKMNKNNDAVSAPKRRTPRKAKLMQGRVRNGAGTTGGMLRSRQDNFPAAPSW